VKWTPIRLIDEATASLRARVHLRLTGGKTGRGLAGEEIRLEIVARSQPDELVVVGLAQYGARLFTVRQRDEGIGSQSVATLVADAANRELEQIALLVMDALHRAYWVQLSEESGATIFDWGEERVTLTRSGETLRREFALANRGPATGRVTIEYPEPVTEPLLPRIVMRNPWCGYEAVIVPIEREPLRKQ
jgi:hypothetical protein